VVPLGSGVAGMHAALWTPRRRVRILPPQLKDPSAGEAQTAPLRRWPEGTPLGDLRAGRNLAAPPHVADPGSRQWRRARQPAREPAHRLPQLQRHPRDALRQEQAARQTGDRLWPLRRPIPAAPPRTALLLAEVRWVRAGRGLPPGGA